MPCPCRTSGLQSLGFCCCWQAIHDEVNCSRLRYSVQERPALSALEHHIRQVPWLQLMEECVLSCLAAACAGLAAADVLRAYRQVGLPLLQCGLLHVPCRSTCR